MTEEEAKTKQCCGPEGCGQPMAWEPSQSMGGVGGQMKPMRGFKRLCIGSACMAWRWDKQEVNLPSRPALGENVTTLAIGHCGLAGAP